MNTTDPKLLAKFDKLIQVLGGIKFNIAYPNTSEKPWAENEKLQKRLQNEENQRKQDRFNNETIDLMMRQSKQIGTQNWILTITLLLSLIATVVDIYLKFAE